MRRMARRKFGRRWKNSVKSTYCSHFLFCILTLVILGAALHTIWIPRMLEFLLSIVDAKSFLDVMLTCKLMLVLYTACCTLHTVVAYSCSIYH